MFGAGRPDKQPADDGAQEPAGSDTSEDSGTPRISASRIFGSSPKVLVVGVAAVAVALAGSAFALTSHTAANRGHEQTAAVQQAAGPISLESFTPTAGASQVDGANPVTVTFSAPLAANSPRPTLRPSIPGSWAVQGSQLIFTPAVAFRPMSRITVSVPSGPTGVRGAGGGLLPKSATEHFTTGAYSQFRIAQILGQLGYLPLTWSAGGSGGPGHESSVPVDEQPNSSQQAMA